jgi:manganese oxidase
MSPDPVPGSPRGSGRRNLLRAMTGGGAAAALSLTAAPGASAATGQDPAAVPDAGAGGGAGADPFAQEVFRPSGRVREFWVQADSYPHNAVPNGRDGVSGMVFTADQTTYQAIGYRAYTANWGEPLPADPGPRGIGPNSGIPGPVLRAEVGDVIKVHFRNNDTHYKWPHSIHPHGVRYDPDSDGGWMSDDPRRPGTAVPYGGTYTYTWSCVPGSVGSWPYHDHAAPQMIARPAAPKATAPKASAPAASAPTMTGSMDSGDVRAFGGGGPVMEIGAELGMFGMIAVSDRNTPEVDREFVLFFHDVSSSDVPSLQQDLSLCNGGAFVDNAPTFTARTGERVRWRVATLGNSFHVFHVHGHRWRAGDGWADSQVLGPATTLTVEYREDNPGDWIYHCHVAAHMMHGMAGRYRVTP